MLSVGLRAFVLLLVLVTLAAAPAARAHTEALSLRTALQRAVQGNVLLRRERVRLPTAIANTYAAEGKFDLQLGLSVDLSQTRTPPIGGGLDAGLRSQQGFRLSLSRALETGGNLSLSANTGRTGSSVAFDCGRADKSDCAFYDNNWSLSFSHPLLRGLGVEIATADIRRSQLQQDLALLDRYTRAVVVIRDVVHHYWQLALAAQDLQLQKDALALAREQLRVTEALIRAGRAAASELAAVKLAIANRQGDVAAREQTLALRSLELQRDFGVQPDLAIGYSVAEAPEATPYPVDPREASVQALRFSPQLRRLQKGLELSDLDIRIAHAAVRPRLDLVASLGTRGRKPDLDESLSQAASFAQWTWTARLQFELPLQNRAARGRHRVALWNKRASEIDTRDVEIGLLQSVNTFALALRIAARRIGLAREAVTYAVTNLKAEQARFAAGRSTNNEVLRRQQELKAAELDVVRAQVDWLVNEASLDTLTGRLLEKVGLSLDGL